MSLVQCRLHPIQIEESNLKKYLVPVLYNSLEQDYRRYRLKVNISVEEISSYELRQLVSIFPWFDPQYPLMVEIGCGTGGFLIQAAMDNPHVNFIGVDVASPCIQRAILQASRQDLKNIFFYNGCANDFFFHDFIKIRFDSVMINFPDPWPKKRHLKRRIVSEAFLKQCFELLKFEGKIYSATDVKSLFEYHVKMFEKADFFQPLTTLDQSNQPPHEFYEYQSKYQLKNLSKSNQVYYTAHIKKDFS